MTDHGAGMTGHGPGTVGWHAGLTESLPDDLDLRDPDLEHVARVLSDHLVRFHPSFRFEERLAARLRMEGARRSRGAGGSGHVPAVLPTPAGIVADAGGVAADGGSCAGGGGRLPVPVIVGGAIASGVSIAGVAVVARRWMRRGA